jgi:aspartyl-tRNA(Asn)/glutamyl-tRNA(Gln) amidotransferase subunit B
MFSPQEARAYLSELKLLLTYLGVSDCNMQEGSLRVDANINLHVPTGEGHAATPIVEVKNMNSFRAVERALDYEAKRQFEVWQETGHKLGEVPKQTRGWDEQAEVTRGQRSKEESSDYRYFPDPDLVPVRVTSAQIEQVRASLGELPAAIRARLQTEHGIPEYDADVMVNQGRGVVDYFVALAEACGDGKQASNWVQQDVLRTLKEREITVEQFPISPASLGELILAAKDGLVDSSRARDVLQEMIRSDASAARAMETLGIEQVDTSAVERLCRELLAENPRIVADVQGGKKQAIGALIGQAKKRNPNVNPNQVRDICLALIDQMP